MAWEAVSCHVGDASRSRTRGPRQPRRKVLAAGDRVAVVGDGDVTGRRTGARRRGRGPPPLGPPAAQGPGRTSHKGTMVTLGGSRFTDLEVKAAEVLDVENGVSAVAAGMESLPTAGQIRRRRWSAVRHAHGLVQLAVDAGIERHRASRIVLEMRDSGRHAEGCPKTAGLTLLVTVVVVGVAGAPDHPGLVVLAVWPWRCAGRG